MRMKRLIIGGATGLILFGAVSPTMSLPFTANGSAVNDATPESMVDVKGWGGGGGGRGGGGFRGGGGARFQGGGAFRGANFRSANFRASAFRGARLRNGSFRTAAINGGRWNGNRWHGNHGHGNRWNGNNWGYYGWGVGALALAGAAYSYYDYGRGCYYDTWGQLYCDYPYDYIQ